MQGFIFAALRGIFSPGGSVLRFWLLAFESKCEGSKSGGRWAVMPARPSPRH